MKSFIRRRIMSQILATILANSTTVVCGMIMTWPIPMISRLTDPSMPNHLTMDEMGWIVSSLCFGSIFGTIISGFLVDWIGKQRTIFISIIPLSAFYIIIDLLKFNYIWLCIVLFLAGALCLNIFCVLPMYITEIVENDIRGAMTVVIIGFSHIGAVYNVTLEWILDQSTFTYLSTVIIIVAIVCIYSLPESPYHFFMVGKDEEARKSLSRLRMSEDVTEELLQIKKYTEERKERNCEFIEFLRTVNPWSFVICMLINLIYLCSGFTFVQIYGTVIFNEAGFVVSGNVSIIILEFILLFPTLFSVYFIDRCGRRILLAISIFVVTVCLLITAIYYNLKFENVNVQAISWIPLVVLIGSCVAVVFGISGTRLILFTELFPINLKAKAVMLLLICDSMISLVGMKCFQVIETKFGEHYLFYGLSVCMIIFGIIVLSMLPETKGQSLEEIESSMEKHNLFRRWFKRIK